MTTRLKIVGGLASTVLALGILVAGAAPANASDPWFVSGLKGQQKCGNGGGSTLTINIPYNGAWKSFSYSSTGYYGPYYFGAPSWIGSGTYTLSCWNGGGKSGSFTFSGGYMNVRNFCANLPWWQFC
jgi:hypothetical protein